MKIKNIVVSISFVLFIGLLVFTVYSFMSYHNHNYHNDVNINKTIPNEIVHGSIKKPMLVCIGTWEDYLLMTQALERKDDDILRRMISTRTVVILEENTVITTSDEDFIYNSNVKWGGYVMSIDSGKYKGRCGYIIKKPEVDQL